VSRRPPQPAAAAVFAAALAAVAVALVCGALLWPLPIQLGESYAPSAFGAAHAWGFDHLWQAITGRALTPTAAVGYPWLREARFIGWVPAALSWPLRPLLGPLGAAQAVMLLSPALSALAMWPLVRRWTDAGPWIRAAACVIYGLSPFLLGTLAIGETPKLQAWCFPLFLLAMDHALTGALRARLAGLAALLLLGVATSFTSPYFGLALPLLAGAGALWSWRRPDRAALLLIAVAVSLLPAFFYYRGSEQQLMGQIFQPAMAVASGTVATPHPVATVKGLLLGDTQPWRGPWEGRHVYYLGTPLLLGLLGLSLWKRAPARGRGAALALIVVATALAMGPRLVVGEVITGVPLPAMLLEWAGYPYATGGMYFRLVVLASLGCALWLAAEGARRPWIVGLLALVQVGDAVRASAPWPRPVVPVPALAVLEELRGGEGAVVYLPLQEGPSLVTGQRALLAAAVHGRPTNALPRDLLKMEVPGNRKFWVRTLGSSRPDVSLPARGISVVVMDLEAAGGRPPPPGWLEPVPDWTRTLGEPDYEGEGLLIWRFKDAAPEPRSVGGLR